MNRRAAVRTVIVLAAGVVASSASGCRCGRGAEGDGTNAASSNEPAVVETRAPAASGEAGAGALSAPIAAAHATGGDVLVAGLDVPGKAIHLLRIGASDEVRAQGTVFDDVKWSSESDLKVIAAASGGAAVTWRGLRSGKMGRALAIVDSGIARKGAPVEVSGPSCATRDAIWFTDGKRAHAKTWAGATIDVDLPKEKEASLVCGTTRAWAFLEEDEGTSFLPLAGADGGRASTVTLIRESDFGEDEQRERSEYTVGDDLGVVRLASSGALAFREVKEGVVGALKKARTRIPHDDDVVAVDASPKALVVVFTQDASSTCPDGQASTKVSAVRIERGGAGEETPLELSTGTCSREVGPFFTNAVGEGVAVAWVERVPVAGKPKPPIVALAHAFVPAAGAAQTVKRIDVAADALVDAGCDVERCYAAALERKAGTDGMVPGPIRVLRYR